MEFRILGPLEVRADGHAVALPGAKPRAVLAMLLLHPNRSVSADQLAHALWGEEAPPGAVNTVQVHVSRLRKALDDTAALVTTAAGYELRIDPRPARRAALRTAPRRRPERAGGRPARSARRRSSRRRWPCGAADRSTISPTSLRAARDRAPRGPASGRARAAGEAKLALGRHAEVVGELEPLIDAYPYRERLRAQLMLALYRCDRQADALQAYQDARRQLVDELGIEPGERLRELERAILAQEPALAAPALEDAGPDSRRARVSRDSPDTEERARRAPAGEHRRRRHRRRRPAGRAARSGVDAQPARPVLGRLRRGDRTPRRHRRGLHRRRGRRCLRPGRGARGRLAARRPRSDRAARRGGRVECRARARSRSPARHEARRRVG